MLTLKELREARGLSLYEVEKAIGVNRGNISRLERGLLNPQASTIDLFLAYYKVKYEDVDWKLDK